MHKAPNRRWSPATRLGAAFTIAAGISMFAAATLPPLIDRYDSSEKNIKRIEMKMDEVSLQRKTTAAEKRTFALRMKRVIPIVFEGDTNGIKDHVEAVEGALKNMNKPCPIAPFPTWKDFVNANSSKIVFTSNDQLMRTLDIAGMVSIANGNKMVMPKMRNSGCAGHTMVHEAAHIYNKDHSILGYLRVILLGYNPELKAEATAAAFDNDPDLWYVRQAEVKFKAVAAAFWFMTAAMLCCLVEVIMRKRQRENET
ncbi:MAG: hypothetical protein WC861_00505 [Candidatus Micrarchaeia archaeon]|jgi:hypothetical protein